MLKKLFSGSLFLAVAWGTGARASEPIDQYPGAAAAYAVAIDDQLVWGRALDTPRPPASLTKLLSALVILDHHWDPDETVTVSARAAGVEGSRIGLRKGDRVRAGDLLTGMIVRSGNDACMTMAEHVGGTSEEFVRLMNNKAAQIGMADSHFRNPCGLDAAGHVSTPRDLLALARVAADSREIATRATEQRAEFRTLSGRRIRFKNTNAMLGREPDAIGLKTGFTNHAGKCLIALAEHGAHRVWIVLLHAPDRWFEASDLMAQGLALAERTATAPLTP
jgi:D-alanyl-D-alanine carboxypeptidase (penicillin-binding protein 5/6)